MIEGLAERLVELRKSKGLTQKILAERLGITKSSVHGWETTRTQPNLLCLMKMSYLYNVSVDYILGMNNNRSLNISNLTDKQINTLTDIINDYEALNSFSEKKQKK